jgi:hypothetical protein
MRFADDSELIEEFFVKYDSLPDADRRNVRIEEVALSIGQNIRHLWGEIQLAIRQYSASSVLTIAADAHPEITKKRIEFAKTPGGFRDRDKLDEILGAIKPAQGSTFINKYFSGTAKMPEDEVEPEQVADDIDAIFPDCSILQERIQPVRQKVLEGCTPKS